MSYVLSWCDFIAGWGGGNNNQYLPYLGSQLTLFLPQGVLGLAVGHPLDTLKVRQQTLPAGTGIIELIKSTYRKEGIPGFFKGLAYPLLGAGVYNALFFGVYGTCLRHLQGVDKGENVRKMCCEKEPPGSNWHRDVFIAGCIGGIATVIYSCPLDVIKIKLQAQTNAMNKPRLNSAKPEPIYKGPLDAMITIYKNYGLRRGLYKGLWCMLWRDVPTFGIYTLSYEHILCLLKNKEDRSSDTTIASQVIAGGVAGVLSWVLVAPLDVIKTRLQADDFSQPLYSGMVDCYKKIYQQEGVRVLFSGTLLMTLRGFPVNAATFVGYEYLVKLCDNWFCSLTWLLIMPIDVLKTKIQADNFARPSYKGISDCFFAVKKAGLRSFYAGLGLALLYAFPANAVKLVSYENLLQICMLKEREDLPHLCDGNKK